MYLRTKQHVLNRVVLCVYIAVVTALPGCLKPLARGLQRMASPSLKSADTVERVYALEDLRDAKTASKEELNLAIDYLMDDSTYGEIIVERGGPTATNIQGTVYRGTEVKYLKGVYTTDKETSFGSSKVRGLAKATLEAHQPAAADAAVERLPKEKSKVMRERLLDVMNHGCRSVRGYASPASVRELRRIIENRNEELPLRKKALKTILILDDPEVTDWVLGAYPRLLKHYSFSQLQNDFYRELGPFIARRPMAMLASFDDPESPIAARTFGVLRSRIAKREMPDAEARTILEEVVKLKYPRTADLLVEVIKRSPSFEMKKFAQKLLVNADNSGQIKFLVDSHKRALGGSDQFTADAIQAALEASEDPEAQKYLNSLDDE